MLQRDVYILYRTSTRSKTRQQHKIESHIGAVLTINVTKCCIKYAFGKSKFT